MKLELNHYYALGIRQLFIVEGDPVYVQSKIMPDNQILNLKPQTYNPDYLIDAIKLAKNMNFNVSAACYPEGHPLAPSLEASIERALEKQAAGCTQLIGQISFTFPPFDSFLTKAGACGLKIPIIMSIMPSVPNKEFLYNFCFRNNISLPHELKIATELERIEYLWHLIKDKNLDICYASLNRFSAFDQWVNKEKNFEIDNIPSISYGFK
ncbi:MAG: methylenetetrahydrofolate reductase [Legionella longbeachae]|nr:methylenetetrahydrofolate reductase [Legionella longbeachae]